MARYLLLSLCLAAASAIQPHAMQKRQIFREQVLPHSGGKIPEEAFRTDRLALNRLNKEGIAIPDGVLLETRHRESHFSSHRQDPDINASIIRIVQRPDGRYAPPEGRYPFNNLVESTYVIRPPINIHGYVGLPPRKPIQSTLQIPARPFFSQGEELLNINNLDSSDLLDTLNHEFPGTRLWTGFGPLFHETANRILRHSGKGKKDQRTPVANQLVSQSQTGNTKAVGTQFARPAVLYSQGIASKQTTSNSKQQPPVIISGQVLRASPSQLTNQILRSAVQPLLSSTTRPIQRLAIGYRQPDRASNAQLEYPSLNRIPKTSFVCRNTGRSMEPDPSTNCQVFHLCHADGKKESFLCPIGTRYDKKSNLCNPWRTVPC
ncbi:uncharacterized protein [Halyomorpha halys]|uniref:uncharacterized protein n=1 Tax=Halyomorpha halys TaxID=286706 RepID=UPI0006D4C6F4